MRRARRAALVTALLGASAALWGASSCASIPDSGRITPVIGPDFEIYRVHVDTYLQRRCGTLDCHGQEGRPYRIYGFSGYRLYNLDAGLVSGREPTRIEEIRANYEAIISLEPEEMNRVMAEQAAEPNRLMFLRKPLRLERHKGGPAMAEDDPGYKCVVAWLRVNVVTGDGTPIPPAQRSFSARAAQECATATAFP